MMTSMPLSLISRSVGPPFFFFLSLPLSLSLWRAFWLAPSLLLLCLSVSSSFSFSRSLVAAGAASHGKGSTPERDGVPHRLEKPQRQPDLPQCPPHRTHPDHTLQFWGQRSSIRLNANGYTNGDICDDAAALTGALFSAACDDCSCLPPLPKIIVGDINASTDRLPSLKKTH